MSKEQVTEYDRSTKALLVETVTFICIRRIRDIFLEPAQPSSCKIIDILDHLPKRPDSAGRAFREEILLSLSQLEPPQALPILKELSTLLQQRAASALAETSESESANQLSIRILQSHAEELIVKIENRFVTLRYASTGSKSLRWEIQVRDEIYYFSTLLGSSLKKMSDLFKREGEAPRE
jgi:hypothetical protein